MAQQIDWNAKQELASKMRVEELQWAYADCVETARRIGGDVFGKDETYYRDEASVYAGELHRRGLTPNVDHKRTPYPADRNRFDAIIETAEGEEESPSTIVGATLDNVLDLLTTEGGLETLVREIYKTALYVPPQHDREALIRSDVACARACCRKGGRTRTLLSALKPPRKPGAPVSATAAVEVLNRALRTDPDCTQALVEHLVPCNDGLVDDPTIQVQLLQSGGTVSVLGLINGLFGLQPGTTIGWICKVVDETTNHIKEFRITDPALFDLPEGDDHE